MGSENAEDEDPPHEVHLGGFYIGKYEITQSQWQQVMGDNPADNVGSSHPVENVSWDDAIAFVARLSEMTERVYRLPTEAEWEYAARAGSTTDFYFGNDTMMLGEYAWHGGNSGGETHPVGQKTPNAWGLFDMAGNVWEWCQDWWDPDYYHRSDTLNPVNETPYVYTNPSSGEQFSARVARSGGIRGPASGLQSAHRHGGRPETRRSWIGFRVVREIHP
jgi:formylglycine-generating enzyme required for sulfatase activity